MINEYGLYSQEAIALSQEFGELVNDFLVNKIPEDVAPADIVNILKGSVEITTAFWIAGPMMDRRQKEKEESQTREVPRLTPGEMP